MVEPAHVLEALKQVQDPDLHRDIVSLGFIKDLKACGGLVSFKIELTTPACPVREQMKEQARTAVLRIPGVEKVDIEMTAQVRSTLGKQHLLTTVRNVVPVASGKGGVGKSTVSANLALALSKLGAKVGVMDADVYGPSIPTILGVSDQPRMLPTQKIVPPRAFGMPVLSMGYFAPPGQAVVVRGPILHKTLEQFLGGVEWGDLDYLIIDLPPGTGDVQLSLCQMIPLTGAAVVSTPQDVALNVASKAIDMFRKLRTTVLGVIENMSGYACPQCGHHDDIFGIGGAREAADRSRWCGTCKVDYSNAPPGMTKCTKCAQDLDRIPFLGAIPLETRIRTSADAGRPIVDSDPKSAAAKAFMEVAERLAAQVSIRGFKQDEGVLQPLVWGKPG